jgi:hypothetical protein
MRHVLLLLFLLLPGVATAQEAPPPTVKVPAVGDWIGTLEWWDSRGLMEARTDVRLVFGDDNAVTGSWRTPGGASGSILGSFADGKFKLTITFYAGAEEIGPDGNYQPIAIERCQGQAVFTGQLLRTQVIRLTASRVSFNDEIKRARNIACEDSTKLVWLLQPHDH